MISSFDFNNIEKIILMLSSFSTVTRTKKTGRDILHLYAQLQHVHFSPFCEVCCKENRSFKEPQKKLSRWAAEAQENTCHHQPPYQNQDPIFHLYHLDSHLSEYE